MSWYLSRQACQQGKRNDPPCFVVIFKFDIHKGLRCWSDSWQRSWGAGGCHSRRRLAQMTPYALAITLVYLPLALILACAVLR